MDDTDRRATAPDDDAPETRHADTLDTGHSTWMRVVTLIVLAALLLATVVAALA